MKYVISYDVGTTGVKTCLFSIDKQIKFISGSYGTYELFILENGGAEQDADEWWKVLCETTKALIKKTGIETGEIAGISFCSQMQGLVLVDKDCKTLRRPMSYMDQRSETVMQANSGKGIKVAGLSIPRLLKCLNLTAAAPTSAKDPVWKYLWVKENEPEVYSKIYKWLDVKEYLIAKATNKCVMTKDSAWATFLYETKNGKYQWNKSLCKMFGVDIDHLPDVIDCTDQAGVLTKKSAEELGLDEGTPVFGGGGDATLIGIGAGCTKVGETHIYSGTSGWVGTITDKQVVDVVSMIASTVGVRENNFNYFAEMETAGKCFEWVKEHLALDEIGIYLKKQDVAESEETIYRSLYEYLSETVSKIPAGSNGVIFTPWLHGNRCPFEDPDASGMFFNIKIETGKTEMIRAVLEGICFHLKWMLECQEKKITTSDEIRFVGGGALSSVTCQMLSDILQRKIITVEDSQDVGAVGAAVLVGIGLGIIPSIDNVADYVQKKQEFIPNKENKAVYEKNYEVFKELYKSNKKLFKKLNG